MELTKISSQERQTAVTTLMARALDETAQLKPGTTRLETPELISIATQLAPLMPQGQWIPAMKKINMLPQYSRDAENHRLATLQIIRGEIEAISATEAFPDGHRAEPHLQTILKDFGPQFSSTAKREAAVLAEKAHPHNWPPAPPVPSEDNLVPPLARVQALHRLTSLQAQHILEHPAEMPADFIQNLQGLAGMSQIYSQNGEKKTRSLDVLLGTTDYLLDDKAHKQAVVRAARRSLEDTTSNPVAIIDGESVNSWQESLRRTIFPGVPAPEMEKRILNEIDHHSTMPPLPPLPPEQTRVTRTQLFHAAASLIDRDCEACMANPAISPETMAQSLRQIVLPESYTTAYVKAIGAAEIYPDEQSRKHMLTVAVREALHKLDGDTKREHNVPEIENLVSTLSPPSDPAKKMVDALRSEISHPGHAAGPVPRRLPPIPEAAQINAINNVVAHTLDENLKPGPHQGKIEFASIGAFAVQMVSELPQQQAKRYKDTLATIGPLTDHDKRLRAITTVARDIMQHQADLSITPVSAENTIERVQAFMGAAFQNPQDLHKAIREELAHPSAKLPPAPELPPEIKPINAAAIETQDPKRVARALVDLEPFLTTTPLSKKPSTPDKEPPSTTIAAKIEHIGHWDPDRNIRVITYSASDDKAYQDDGSSVSRHKLSDEKLRILKEGFVEISKVANVEFKPITDPKLAPRADLLVGEGELGKPSWAGYCCELNSLGFKQQQIMVRSSDVVTPETSLGILANFLHETQHALDIPHPGAKGKGGEAGGDNPDYTTRSTVMSYINNAAIPGLGPYDIRALVDMFGKSQTMPDYPDYKLPELMHTSTIYAGRTATIDLNDPAYTGSLSINLSHNGMTPILGDVKGPDGQTHVVDPRIAIDNKVDIDAGSHTNIKLNLTGKAGAVLPGGNMDDVLIARGGANTLTGGKGADMFVIDMDSGNSNVITDFQSSENDKLIIRTGADEIRVRESVKDGVRGTLVELGGKGTEKSVSSVFVANVSPDELKGNIIQVSAKAARADVVAAAPKSVDTPFGIKPVTKMAQDLKLPDIRFGMEESARKPPAEGFQNVTLNLEKFPWEAMDTMPLGQHPPKSHSAPPAHNKPGGPKR